MKLLLVFYIVTHILFICEAERGNISNKSNKNERKKLKVRVKTEKYSPLNIWKSQSIEKKKRRNLIVKCCGSSNSCLNVGKTPANDTAARTLTPRKDGKDAENGNRKSAGGKDESGGNIPTGNNPSNYNPKNTGDKALSGEGSGSVTSEVSGPSKTDEGSAVAEGSGGAVTSGAGVKPGGGKGVDAANSSPGQEEESGPDAADPLDKQSGGGGVLGVNAAPGQPTSKSSGGIPAGGAAGSGGETTSSGQVPGNGNSGGGGAIAPSPGSSNSSGGGSAPASGTNNTAAGGGVVAPSPGSKATVGGATAPSSGNGNAAGGAVGAPSSGGNNTAAGGGGVAPSPGGNNTAAGGGGGAPSSGGSSTAAGGGGTTAPGGSTAAGGGGGAATPASGSNAITTTGPAGAGNSSSGGGGADSSTNETKTGDGSSGGGSSDPAATAPPKQPMAAGFKGIIPRATTDSPYQKPSDSGPEPTNAPNEVETFCNKKKPLYVSSRKCERDRSLFDGDGKLINASSYGLFVQLCNESLLFGSKLSNWTTNHDSCCALGMSPLYILGRKDNWCLQKYIYDSWTLNHNYWSGGIKDNDTQAAYAPFNNTAPTPALNWASTINEDFHCLKMTIDKTSTPYPHKMVWNFKNCSKLQLMACKAPVTTTPVPRCTKWKRDRTLFKEKDGSLTEPSQYGNWFRAFNHTFLFGTKQNWTNAHKTCGRLGMKLVSLNLPVIEKYIRHLTNKEGFSNKSYWTSGYDRFNPGKYNWCSANNSVVEGINWKNGQEGKTEGCLKVFYHIIPKPPALKLPIASVVNPLLPAGRKRRFLFGAPPTTTPQPTTTTEGPKDLNGTFQVSDCGEENNFICMAAVMKTPMQKQKDCMAAFSITQNDIDTILSMDTYSENMRCFMRCMGDELDLVFDNLPVDVEIIKLLEDNGGSEPKVDKHFDIYDVCGKERGALDKCETTAKVFKCGVEKDPQGMADLIVGSAAKAEEDANAGNVVSDLSTTCRSSPCILDVFSPVLDYFNGPGKFFIEACGKVYFVGAGLLIGGGMYEAHSYCCKYGMQLARFETRQEADCFAKTMQASPYGYKFLDGGVRTFGTNEDNPEFPVWCPDKTPIDVTLFPGYSTDPNLATGLYIYVWTVFYPPVFVQVDFTTAYDFACEDP